jgi:hypothetical protein
MSNYTKLTNFASKDSLASGNPLKVIKGTEIDDEFEAIETAVGTKADLASPTFTGIPTAPTASAGTSSTQIATTAFVLSNGVPSGAIMMWSGSVASIPSGWYLCDGNNGTPNLQNRFVVGAGDTYAVDATGGSASSVASHTHSVTDSGHTHNFTVIAYDQDSAGVGALTGGSPGNYDGQFDGTTASSTTGVSIGTTGTSDGNLPPYYALAYIMKA